MNSRAISQIFLTDSLKAPVFMSFFFSLHGSDCVHSCMQKAWLCTLTRQCLSTSCASCAGFPIVAIGGYILNDGGGGLIGLDSAVE